MKVLLIGGTGIISKEVCRLSLEKGYEVFVLNRGKTNEHLLPGAKLILGDIRKETISELREKINSNYDVIVDFITYNEEQLRKTISFTKGMCRQYVFISSATVYSKKLIDNEKYVESDSIDNPDWQYAAEKSKCEHWLKENDIGVPYTIIRPYVTYGETRIPFQIVTSDYYTLLNRILCDKPILVSGKESACTLTYSRDFAIGLVGCFLNEMAYNEVFHITTDEEMTWEKCIQTVGKKLNKTVKIIDVPVEKLKEYNCKFLNFEEIIADKGRNNRFDNSKIKKVVPEYKANTMFEDGIEDAINYYINKKKVNYAWDAQVDYAISRYLKKSAKNQHIYMHDYNQKMKFKNKVEYIINRYRMIGIGMFLPRFFYALGRRGVAILISNRYGEHHKDVNAP